MANASGGTPPYHFCSDTFRNSPPPLGTVVTLNGDLSGTINAAGIYNFSVCVIDMLGACGCGMTQVTVVSAVTTTYRSSTTTYQSNSTTTYQSSSSSSSTTNRSSTTTYNSSSTTTYQSSSTTTYQSNSTTTYQSSSSSSSTTNRSSTTTYNSSSTTTYQSSSTTTYQSSSSSSSTTNRSSTTTYNSSSTTTYQSSSTTTYQSSSSSSSTTNRSSTTTYNSSSTTTYQSSSTTTYQSSSSSSSTTNRSSTTTYNSSTTTYQSSSSSSSTTNHSSTTTYNSSTTTYQSSSTTYLNSSTTTYETSTTTTTTTSTTTIPELTIQTFFPTDLCSWKVNQQGTFQAATATGGTPPYSFYSDPSMGSLPPGIDLDSDGNLSGTPTQSGQYLFAVCVADSLGLTSCEMNYSMNVCTNLVGTWSGSYTLVHNFGVCIDNNPPCISNAPSNSDITMSGTLTFNLSYDPTCGSGQILPPPCNCVSGDVTLNNMQDIVPHSDANGNPICVYYYDDGTPYYILTQISHYGTIGGLVDSPSTDINFFFEDIGYFLHLPSADSCTGYMYGMGFYGTVDGNTMTGTIGYPPGSTCDPSQGVCGTFSLTKDSSETTYQSSTTTYNSSSTTTYPSSTTTYQSSSSSSSTTYQGNTTTYQSSSTSVIASPSSSSSTTNLSSTTTYNSSSTTYQSSSSSSTTNLSSTTTYNSSSTTTYLCSPNWTWVSGSNLIDQSGNYGTQGVPAAGNVPGSENWQFRGSIALAICGYSEGRALIQPALMMLSTISGTSTALTGPG